MTTTESSLSRIPPNFEWSRDIVVLSGRSTDPRTVLVLSTQLLELSEFVAFNQSSLLTHFQIPIQKKFCALLLIYLSFLRTVKPLVEQVIGCFVGACSDSR